MPQELVVRGSDSINLTQQAMGGSRTAIGRLLRALVTGQCYQVYAGNPNGNLLPNAIGEWCLDTASTTWYKAKTLLINGWARVSAGEDAAGTVNLFDDFAAKTINSNCWDLQKGSDAATVNFATNAQIGGVVRAVTGAGAGASMAVNGVQICNGLYWKTSNGGLKMETRIKLSAITTIALFVGFTNQVAALQAPIIGAGGGNTFTANAADAVGFVFDTTMTAANFWCQGVAASAQATAVNTGAAPVAATFYTLSVELSAAGVATFYRNGSLVGTVSAAVTAATALTPVVTAFTRAAGSANIDLDYLRTSMNR